jgi:periplasmic divalent cation tolerance protein
MKAGDFGVISTTVAQKDDAERIAALLLSEKLAACVQIMGINSRYVWKGETNHEPELMLLIKTRSALFDKVIARIAAEHPYETPEIVAMPFAAGFAGYFDWIAENTGPA